MATTEHFRSLVPALLVSYEGVLDPSPVGALLDEGALGCFPGGPDGKESECNAGVLSLIPKLGRSPGEDNGYPLQCSCLQNSQDRGAWRATVHGVTKSQT